MFIQEQQQITSAIRAFCAKSDLPDPGEINWNPIPFAGEWGISTSLFQLAAQEARSGKAPGDGQISIPQRAQQIAEKIVEYIGKPEGIVRVEAVRGYLNLYFSVAEYANRVVDAVLEQGANFGRGAPREERVMVEYAQPNTHHSFHIGHARNAILGEALARLVEFAGFDTIRATYPGDIGLGVITVLWAYRKFYKGQEPDGVHERGQWLLKIYVEATELLTPRDDETPEEKSLRETYEAERRELLRLWDARDPEIRQLWLKTRQWSLDELNDIFQILDIHIDVWFFESEVDELAKSIVDELISRGIADDERPRGGAVIVKIDEKLGLKKEKYRTNVILRSDGTTLYLTKDLALAKVKFERYHVDRSIYVIDVRQSLHMQQAFKILELWGFPQASKCYHLGYGFVSLPEGAMSARRGRLVLFKDVLEEAERRVLTLIEERNPNLPAEARLQIARQVGLGALKYAILSVDNNKDTVFEYDTALNFDGHTGPYIQYAHVRCNSILRKAEEEGINWKHTEETLDQREPPEIQLIDLISRFPAEVQRATNEYKPLTIANLAYDLARAFNDFYDRCPVLKADTKVRDARLRLVTAARQTIANALRLLGIEAPDVM
jgi:arginyl-tRNA synthetase